MTFTYARDEAGLYICPHCGAKSWHGEHVDCCGGGRLQLPIADDVPQELADIILSAHVRQHIRRQDFCYFSACVDNDHQV